MFCFSSLRVTVCVWLYFPTEPREPSRQVGKPTDDDDDDDEDRCALPTSIFPELPRASCGGPWYSEDSAFWGAGGAVRWSQAPTRLPMCLSSCFLAGGHRNGYQSQHACLPRLKISPSLLVDEQQQQLQAEPDIMHRLSRGQLSARVGIVSVTEPECHGHDEELILSPLLKDTWQPLSQGPPFLWHSGVWSTAPLWLAG